MVRMTASAKWMGFAIAGAAVVGGAILVWSWMQPEPLPEGVLFGIDAQTYGVADLARYRGSEVPFRSRYQAEQALEGFVDHLLLQRAARGLDPGEGDLLDHEVLERLVEAEGLRATVDDEAIEDRYEAERNRFVHPRLIRLAYFAAEDDGAAAAQRAPEALRSVYVRAQMNLDSRSFHELLAGEHPGLRSGVLGGVPCGGGKPHDPLPADVVAQACTLPTGALHGPIRVANDWWVVRVLSGSAASRVPLDRVRQELRRSLELGAERSAKDEALARLRAKARIRIDEDALASLVETQEFVPTADPGTPPRPPEFGS
jgi:hypothetical protein